MVGHSSFQLDDRSGRHHCNLARILIHALTRPNSKPACVYRVPQLRVPDERARAAEGRALVPRAQRHWERAHRRHNESIHRFHRRTFNCCGRNTANF
jgi:hypothetical protein